MFTGVVTSGAWNKKWVLFISFSLTLWDLLHCFSVFSLSSLHPDFELLLWNSNAAYNCLFELDSSETLWAFCCFFLRPRAFLFGLIKSNRSSSFSTWFENCGDTYIKKNDYIKKYTSFIKISSNAVLWYTNISYPFHRHFIINRQRCRQKWPSCGLNRSAVILLSI